MWLQIHQTLFMQLLITWNREDFVTAIVMNIFKMFCFISYSFCKWNIYINGDVLLLVFKLLLNIITAISPTHRWTLLTIITNYRDISNVLIWNFPQAKSGTSGQFSTSWRWKELFRYWNHHSVSLFVWWFKHPA